MPAFSLYRVVKKRHRIRLAYRSSGKNRFFIDFFLLMTDDRGKSVRRVHGMENKRIFAEFIAQKRKAAGFTQKELAQRLFVSDTAVSKWERGISYPDITLIPGICKELQISEHEFFTACDDLAAREEKRQAKSYRKAKKTYQWTMYICYAVTLITCFICNLAVDHRLSWFFIVLVSVAIGFSVTNLPLLLKKHNTLIVSGCVTVGTYLLLFVCWLLEPGTWFYEIALPVATISLLLCWLIMLVIRYLRINALYKTAVVLTIVSLSVPAINSLENGFPGTDAFLFQFRSYFDWTVWQGNGGTLGNKIAVGGMLLLAAAFLVAGIVLAVMRISKKKKAGVKK